MIRGIDDLHKAGYKDYLRSNGHKEAEYLKPLSPVGVHKESGITIVGKTAKQVYPGTSKYNVLTAIADGTAHGNFPSSSDLRNGISDGGKVASVVMRLRQDLFGEDSENARYLLCHKDGEKAVYSFGAPFRYLTDTELQEVEVDEIALPRPRIRPVKEWTGEQPRITPISERFGVIRIDDDVLTIPQGIQLEIMLQLIRNAQRNVPSEPIHSSAKQNGSTADYPAAYAVRFLRTLLGDTPNDPHIITSAYENGFGYKLNAVVEPVTKKVKSEQNGHMPKFTEVELVRFQ